VHNFERLALEAVTQGFSVRRFATRFIVSLLRFFAQSGK
jgi:hypothetical protein